jgi:hypothetical protein
MYSPIRCSLRFILIFIQLDRATANLFFGCNIPASVVESPFFQEFFEAARRASPAAVLPHRKKLLGPLLLDAAARQDERLEKELTSAVAAGGTTLVTDGVTVVSRPFTNFIIVSPRAGAISLGIHDSTVDLAQGKVKDAAYVAQLIMDKVKTLPAGCIVHVCTDGESKMVAALPPIEQALPGVATSTCASHQLNLYMKAVGNIVAVAEVLAKGQALADIFKNREKPRALLHAATVKHLGKPMSVVIGADTRFGTHFMVLHRLRLVRPALETVAAEPEFKEMARVEKKLEEARRVIMSGPFWQDVGLLVDSLWPAMLLLRFLDSDMPVSGWLVHGWRRVACKLGDIAANARWNDASERERTVAADEVDEMLELYKNRQATYFFPIHYAAFLTNPKLVDVDVSDDSAAIEAFTTYAKIVWHADPDPSARARDALEQLTRFKAKDPELFSQEALDACKTVGLASSAIKPAVWWGMYGTKVRALRIVAQQALSQIVSIGAAERGHHTHKWIHNKVRNRLLSSTASDLVKVNRGLRMERRLAAVVEEEQEEGDRKGAVALAAMEQWWAEEVDLRGEAAVADFELSDGGAGGGVQKRVFNAWHEDWEVENLRANKGTAAMMFRNKYVGMKLRVGDVGDEEELEVVAVEWDKSRRPYQWKAKVLPLEAPADAQPEFFEIGTDLFKAIVQGAELNKGIEIKYSG